MPSAVAAIGLLLLTGFRGRTPAGFPGVPSGGIHHSLRLRQGVAQVRKMSMSKNAPTLHAAAGEHLVLGELLRHGIEAYLAQGSTQPGWDILTRQNGAFKMVQVKTIDWPGNAAVNISPSTVRDKHHAQFDQTQCFDVMVVVLLCKNMPRSRFLFLTPEEVRERWTEPKEDPSLPTSLRHQQPLEFL